MNQFLRSNLFLLLCSGLCAFAALRSPAPAAAQAGVIPTHGEERNAPVASSMPRTDKSPPPPSQAVQEPAGAAALAGKVDVSALARATVQHNSTLKTFDTFARQAVSAVTGRGTLDGDAPAATLLDMCYRPWAYADRDLIKIANLPVREEVADALGLTTGEPRRLFLKNAKISLADLSQARGAGGTQRDRKQGPP